jgi:hypothetical protein
VLLHLVSEERTRRLAIPAVPQINFIGRAAPAALLFQAGTKDELIAQADARRYQQAQGDPLVCGWPWTQLQAHKDMMAWLACHILINPKRYKCQP